MIASLYCTRSYVASLTRQQQYVMIFFNQGALKHPVGLLHSLHPFVVQNHLSATYNLRLHLFTAQDNMLHLFAAHNYVFYMFQSRNKKNPSIWCICIVYILLLYRIILHLFTAQIYVQLLLYISLLHRTICCIHLLNTLMIFYMFQSRSQNTSICCTESSTGDLLSNISLLHNNMFNY